MEAFLLSKKKEVNENPSIVSLSTPTVVLILKYNTFYNISPCKATTNIEYNYHFENFFFLLYLDINANIYLTLITIHNKEREEKILLM